MKGFASASGLAQAAGEPLIRSAAAADLPALTAIRNWAIANTSASFAVEPEPLASWQERWKEKCATHPWLVAEVRGAVVGYALAHGLLGGCGLSPTVETSAYVAVEQQNRGVGTALYRRLIALLRAQNITSVAAVISVPNPASERLHESFGFRRAGTLERVGWKFGRWHDVGCWQLVLSEPAGAPPGILTVAAAEALLEDEDRKNRPGEHRSRENVRTERQFDDKRSV